MDYRDRNGPGRPSLPSHAQYEFRSNSGPCLIYTPWQRLSDVSTHEIRLDLNLYSRRNSDLYLTGDLRQMLPGVIAYGIQFDLNLYHAHAHKSLITVK